MLQIDILSHASLVSVDYIAQRSVTDLPERNVVPHGRLDECYLREKPFPFLSFTLFYHRFFRYLSFIHLRYIHQASAIALLVNTR